MKSNNVHFNELLKLILPPEIFKYFEVRDIEVKSREVHVYLDEINSPPASFKGKKLLSKGFHSEAVIQDFPLRDKALFLHVRRRRWLEESSQKIIERDWTTVAEGTRLTTGFATFLKGVFG